MPMCAYWSFFVESSSSSSSPHHGRNCYLRRGAEGKKLVLHRHRPAALAASAKWVTGSRNCLLPERRNKGGLGKNCREASMTTTTAEEAPPPTATTETPPAPSTVVALELTVAMKKPGKDVSPLGRVPQVSSRPSSGTEPPPLVKEEPGASSSPAVVAATPTPTGPPSARHSTTSSESPQQPQEQEEEEEKEDKRDKLISEKDRLELGRALLETEVKLLQHLSALQAEIGKSPFSAPSGGSPREQLSSASTCLLNTISTIKGVQEKLASKMKGGEGEEGAHGRVAQEKED